MTTYTVNNAEQEKKIYCGREYEHNLTTNTQYNYIYVGNMPVALYVQGDSNAMYTLHTNHLGSIEKITNTAGEIVDSMSYTPFGQRRSVTEWTRNDTVTHLIDRGFTGQQHLDNFALINFNGRMYDPVLAHFLSPDPYIQNPENPLNYNRYSYCLYSPLQYVDPSGFFVDWYENAITKELKWFNSQENIILNEKGIWTNIGQELLIFNGEFLTYYTQRKDDKNNLTLIKTQYPAVSGKPDENSNFDYSKNAQAKPFKGPIPEGDYSINPQEIQKFDELNFFNKTISTFGIAGKFKGGKIAWGDERVWITPSSVQVANPNAENEFINRSNFSIHGGSTPGSAGCIDLHKNAHSFFNKLSQSNSSLNSTNKCNFITNRNRIFIK